MCKSNSFKIILIILCFFLFLQSGCKNKTDTPATDTTILVEAVQVRQGDIAGVLQFTGSIEAEAEVTIFSQITARIEDIKVGLGDPVHKGDLLARLESEELAAQLAQARAALAVVQAKWAQMERGARPEEIAQAEDLLTKADAALKEAESNYKRSKEMLDRHIISEKQFESSEVAYTIAQADLGSAQEHLKILRDGATKEDRDALKAQVRQADAAVELAKIRLSQTRILSPLDGIVSERFFQTGDLATPGKPLFTVVRMDTVKAVISFRGKSIQIFKRGEHTAQVIVAAFPNKTFDGKIERISPTLNPQTRMFNAEIMLDNTDHDLRPGMFATIRFLIDPRSGALLVPKEAVLFPEGVMDVSNNETGSVVSHAQVFVIHEQTVQKQEVTVGHMSGDLVEIRDGLKLSDLVVYPGIV